MRPPRSASPPPPRSTPPPAPARGPSSPTPAPPWPDPTVVTIETYDGVHLDHQTVIAEVRRIAAARHAKSAVVTFDRHPAMVVRPESAPPLLTDLDQKLELLTTTDIDGTFVVT